MGSNSRPHILPYHDSDRCDRSNYLPSAEESSGSESESEIEEPLQKSQSERLINRRDSILPDLQKLKKNFLKKIFGYLARCEAKFRTTTLFFKTNRIKINQNAGKMPSKFENRALKTLFEICNRDLKTLNPKP